MQTFDIKKPFIIALYFKFLFMLTSHLLEVLKLESTDIISPGNEKLLSLRAK